MRCSWAAFLPILAGMGLAFDVRYCEDSFPTTMNPLFARTEVDRRTADLVFDRLVYRNDVNQALQSDLLETDTTGAIRSESMEVGNGLKLYVKPGITWHDGQPFTADDVCFTIDAMRNETTPSPVAKPFREALAGCQVAGDGEFVVHFLREFREPLAQLQFYVVPKHAFTGTSVSPDLDFSQHPIGTGPMSGIKSRKGVAFSAYPNGHHHAQFEHMALIESGDPVVMLHGLLNGDLHGIVSLPSRLQTEVANSSVASLRSTGSQGYLFVALNTQRGPLADRRVRQALNLLIDRTALREVTMGFGAAKPDPEFVSGPFLRTSPYYDPKVKVVEHPDVAAADALLIAAGAVKSEGKWLWDGQPITLKIASNTSLDVEAWELNRQLRSELESAGFGTLPYPVERSEWAYAVVIGDRPEFDLAIGQWTLRGPDAVQRIFHSRTPDGLGDLNLFNYDDPDTDALLNSYDDAKTDIEARDAYRSLHAHLAEDLPYLFLWSIEQRSAWRNEIADVTIGADRYFGTFDQWHVAAP